MTARRCYECNVDISEYAKDAIRCAACDPHEAPADPILAVLEAAGREAWKHGTVGFTGDGWSYRIVGAGPGCPEVGEARLGAIVRAVNSFAGAREALRAVTDELVLWVKEYGHPSEVSDLVAQARAALAKMEGES